VRLCLPIFVCTGVVSCVMCDSVLCVCSHLHKQHTTYAQNKNTHAHTNSHNQAVEFCRCWPGWNFLGGTSEVTTRIPHCCFSFACTSVYCVCLYLCVCFRVRTYFAVLLLL